MRFELRACFRNQVKITVVLDRRQKLLFLKFHTGYPVVIVYITK